MSRILLIGFLFGVTIPAGIGIRLLVHEMQYQASHPLTENHAYCGMGLLVAWVLMLFVGPICGVVGAVIAKVGSRFFLDK